MGCKQTLSPVLSCHQTNENGRNREKSRKVSAGCDRPLRGYGCLRFLRFLCFLLNRLNLLNRLVLLNRPTLLDRLVPPGTCIAHAAPARALALASPAKFLGQVLRGDLCEELVLVRAAQDIDLVDGNLVEKVLDHGIHSVERPWRVDDVKLAHDLWIAVLSDLRRRHDVVLHAVEVGQRDVLQVQDRAEGLHGVTHRLRRRWHAQAHRPFVLADQPFQ